LEGEIKHDEVTQWLAHKARTSAEFWTKVKPYVREIESEEGVLITDVTQIENRPHPQSPLPERRGGAKPRKFLFPSPFGSYRVHTSHKTQSSQQLIAPSPQFWVNMLNSPVLAFLLS